MSIKKFNQLNINKLYTYSDYLAWKFKERVELIKGKVFKMAAPSSQHQFISSDLHIIFGKFFENKPCKVVSAPFDVRLPIPKDNKIYTVVQPDLCVICDKSKIDKRGAIGAPDLIVEILSPNNSKRDLLDKFNLYQEAGVKEYWIVSPREKTVLIYILKKDKYIGLQPFTEENKLKSVVFKNLKIDLKKIF